MCMSICKIALIIAYFKAFIANNLYAKEERQKQNKKKYSCIIEYNWRKVVQSPEGSIKIQRESLSKTYYP